MTEKLLTRARRRLSPAPPALDPALRPAAVLVPIITRTTAPMVLFTRRRADLPDHPGQICFPGGGLRAGEDPLRAALREAEEETGLPAENVTILGFLPACRTGAGFAVAPVVGLVDPAFTPRLCPREVAEIFEVPLAFLLDEANHRRERRENASGAMKDYWVMTWRDYDIWGATAAMVRALWEATR